MKYLWRPTNRWNKGEEERVRESRVKTGMETLIREDGEGGKWKRRECKGKVRERRIK